MPLYKGGDTIAYTVDDIEIQIKSDAETAAAAIEKLSTALDNLKTACDGAKEPLGTVKDTISEMAGMSNNLSGLTKGANYAKNALMKLNEAGKDTEGIENLNNALSAFNKTDISATANALETVKDSVKQISSGGGKSGGSGTSATENMLDRLATKANITRAKFTALSIAIAKITGALADCVNSANEYIETVNLFQVAMGGYYDEAFEYAQLVSDKLGIDPSQWMNAQGTFMSIAKGFGVTEKQAYDLSEGLTELSYDISSLYNESVETSITRLQSALAGEIEPIRRLGISISQATLQEYAMAHGINESVSSMTEQEKALLRSMVLMESASKIGAVGDFAKTLESPANALRVLQQQFVQLARAIGNVFIPMLVQIIPVVQAVVSVLTDLINFLARLVGFKMPEWDSNSWSKGLVTGADDANKALTGAGTAAKKLKDYTMGIDELNVINPNSGSGGGAGGSSGIGDWAKDLEIPDLWNKEEIAEMQTQMAEIKKTIEEMLPFVIAVGAAFALWKFGPTLLTGLQMLMQAFGLLGGKYIVPTNGKVLELTKLLKFTGVGLVIAALVSRFIELYNSSESFRNGVQRAGEVIKEVFGFGKDILEGVWKVLKDIGEILLALIPEEARQAIKDFFSEMDLDAKDVALTIAGLALLFVPGGQLLGAAVLGFEGISVLLRGYGSESEEEFQKGKQSALDSWDQLKTGADEKWGNIKDSILDNIEQIQNGGTMFQTNTESSWSTYGNTVETALSGAFGNSSQSVSDNLAAMADNGNLFQSESQTSWGAFGTELQRIFGDSWTAMNKEHEDGTTELSNIQTNWQTGFTTDWEALWDGLKPKITELKDKAKEDFDEMWKNIKDGFTEFQGKAPSLTQAISDKFHDGFIKMLNRIIVAFEDGINKIIDGWNDLISIGDAIPGINNLTNAMKGNHIVLPRVQGMTNYYANGGFPANGEMFIARERGPELVGSIGRKTAVANNNQIVEGIAEGVYSAVVDAMYDSAGNSSGGEMNASFNIYLSGKQIAAEVEQVNKRKGVKIMSGGSY